MDLKPLGDISNETIYNVTMELATDNPSAFAGVISIKSFIFACYKFLYIRYECKLWIYSLYLILKIYLNACRTWG